MHRYSKFKESAPERILYIICCNCRTRNPCGTACPCRHNGIKCMSACGQCYGVECSNGMELELSQDSDKSSCASDSDQNVFEYLFNM